MLIALLGSYRFTLLNLSLPAAQNVKIARLPFHILSLLFLMYS